MRTWGPMSKLTCGTQCCALWIDRHEAKLGCHGRGGGANPSLGSLVHYSDCSIQDFGQCFSLFLASPSVCTLPLHLHLYPISHSLSALIATDDDLCKNKSKYLAKKLRFFCSTVILHCETNFHLCLLPVLAITPKEKMEGALCKELQYRCRSL